MSLYQNYYGVIYFDGGHSLTANDRSTYSNMAASDIAQISADQLMQIWGGETWESEIHIDWLPDAAFAGFTSSNIQGISAQYFSNYLRPSQVGKRVKVKTCV